MSLSKSQSNTLVMFSGLIVAGAAGSTFIFALKMMAMLAGSVWNADLLLGFGVVVAVVLGLAYIASFWRE